MRGGSILAMAHDAFFTLNSVSWLSQPWSLHTGKFTSIVCFREGSRLEEHLVRHLQKQLLPWVDFIPGHQKDLFVLCSRAFWVAWYDEKHSLVLKLRLRPHRRRSKAVEFILLPEFPELFRTGESSLVHQLVSSQHLKSVAVFAVVFVIFVSLT